MRISIRSKEARLKLTLPVPLAMGSIIIRCIPNESFSKEQKKIAIELFKGLKGTLREYRGLRIVEVESQSGEYVSITL
ncbi:hypothetical protein SAMN02745196_02667 [Clostridium collagenovorans DSM 3089]|uniref:Uncharacterized protein n=1 Tax=Clostridium collagenovorans DSM 3089 TaxID=1121306 RepID=A0A1M5Y540_9CLOT|nr:hypothetical protein [Clostridium collagenovorans]SHI07122.1 hypothetical protein SAMN02745196_02667 [Clostridium collagenovorans DSM 3089]